MIVSLLAIYRGITYLNSSILIICFDILLTYLVIWACSVHANIELHEQRVQTAICFNNNLQVGLGIRWQAISGFKN